MFLFTKKFIGLLIVSSAVILFWLSYHYIDISHNMQQTGFNDIALNGQIRTYQEVYLDGVRGLFLSFFVMFFGILYLLSKSPNEQNAYF